MAFNTSLGNSIDLHTAASLEDDSEGFGIALMSVNEEINKQNKSGWTPLMYASQSCSLQITQALLQHNADQSVHNHKGQTAFLLAASNGHEEILKLLNIELYLDAPDCQGWTPLMHAVARGHVVTAKFLIQKGANVNSVDEASGRSVLMMAAADRLANSLVPLMVRCGADHLVKSKDMKTAADIASEHTQDEIAAYLHNPYNYHIPRRPPMDLRSLLESMQLHKYVMFFEERQVDLRQFLTFSEQSLKELGIRLLGPRKKMALAIESYNYDRAMGLHMSERDVQSNEA